MSETLVVGRFQSLFGVRGWLKVYSHTRPPANIGLYRPWLVTNDGSEVELEPLQVRLHGRTLVAHIAGYDDRDAAADLLGKTIAIRRTQLPALAPGEFYWRDLIGMHAVNAEGRSLGIVKDLLETGASDVLVVTGENDKTHLVPYVPDVYVLSVNVETGTIVLAWQPDY